jgi:hypothetical protein
MAGLRVPRNPLQKFIIRKRGTGHYVDRWRGVREDVAQALAFPSVEEAEFHRAQLRTSPDEYETCELTADGQIIPV